ncbi:malto-oligosyltrehalose trehalohydrolase [soil metagenome]
MNRFGCQVLAGQGVQFRLWAPAASSVELRIEGRESIAMKEQGEGWYLADADEAVAGDRYRFCIDNEKLVPDPASHFNPDGPHGSSMVVNHASYAWNAASQEWKGRPWHESVFYELHVGTFTPEGTYAAAAGRLAALAEMGVTVIQLMPIAAFPGEYGWGYDGVLPFAPHAAYGTPDDLRAFVSAAHELKVGVMLDVVYNHFGPDGNFLSVYAPQFMSTKHKTAWGAAINFDGEGCADVRSFFVQSALHWFREYRIDGFRFDAVHAMLDDSDPDIMKTIAAALRAEAALTPGRHFFLVLENDSNDASRLVGGDLQAGFGVFDGQWNGDFHHPVHVLLTGETDGYYEEYAEGTLGQLGRVMTQGFSRQGGPHNAPGTKPRTAADSTIALAASINFLQNHDHVGNRAFGERLIELSETEPLRLAVAMCLLSPPPPLLFMGEEWGATTPFLYFSDYADELREAITKGRREEFAQFPRFSDPAVRAQIPDPCSEATFHQSKLDWRATDLMASRRWKALYTELLATRKRDIEPLLPRLRTGAHDFEVIDDRALRVLWRFSPANSESAAGKQDVLEMIVNMSEQPTLVPRSQRQRAGVVESMGTIDIDADGDVFGAWSGRWQWTRE